MDINNLKLEDKMSNLHRRRAGGGISPKRKAGGGISPKRKAGGGIRPR